MTDKPYTPTTEQVRDGFRYDELAEWYDPVTPHHVINGRAFDRWLTDHEITVRIRLLDDLLEIAEKHDGQVPEEQLRFLKEFGKTTLEASHD